MAKKKLGWIEKYDTEICRIRGSCKKAGVPLPEFKEIADGFLVTLKVYLSEPAKKNRVIEIQLMIIKKCSKMPI